MSDKVCSECGDTRPDDAINFPLYRKACAICLACVAKKRKMAALRKEEYRSRKMGKIEGQAVDTLLANARQGGATVPHSAELLEQLMTYWGGVGGFSAMLLKQYMDSKPGSATRTKLLEMIIRLTTVNAEQGGSKRPLTFWSEDELNEEIEGRLMEAARGLVPKIAAEERVETTVPSGATLEVEEEHE